MPAGSRRYGWLLVRDRLAEGAEVFGGGGLGDFAACADDVAWAVLAMALFTPDAAPEKRGSTESAHLVSGAITNAMPMPKVVSPGRKCLK